MSEKTRVRKIATRILGEVLSVADGTFNSVNRLYESADRSVRMLDLLIDKHRTGTLDASDLETVSKQIPDWRRYLAAEHTEMGKVRARLAAVRQELGV
jgi:hypothetical protein